MKLNITYFLGHGCLFFLTIINSLWIHSLADDIIYYNDFITSSIVSSLIVKTLTIVPFLLYGLFIRAELLERKIYELELQLIKDKYMH